MLQAFYAQKPQLSNNCRNLKGKKGKVKVTMNLFCD